MQRVVAIPYRRFGTTYRFLFKVQETSVRNYRHTERNTPEECRPRCCILLTKRDPCEYFVMMATCMVRNMLQ